MKLQCMGKRIREHIASAVIAKRTFSRGIAGTDGRSVDGDARTHVPEERSNLGELDAHKSEQDEFDEIPELTAEDFARSDLVWRMNGKTVEANAGKRAFSAAMKKQKINFLKARNDLQ